VTVPRRGDLWTTKTPATQTALVLKLTFIPKTSLASCERRVDTQTLTDANNMLFKILATPE
jgi:hypothetical protein